ncbi:MAG: PilZ domain-containing protein [Nitrospinae bacterium]|nr:PilZ domain-containing protein [Nitrospinota bacterium]
MSEITEGNESPYLSITGACKRATSTEVFIDGRREGFKTAFVGVDTEQAVFHTDQLLPMSGERIISASAKPVHFSFQLNGINHRFAAKYAGSGVWGGFPSIKFHMPASVKSYQRRLFFRVTPMNSQPVRINLNHGDMGISAEALDISMGGTRFTISCEVENGSTPGISLILPISTSQIRAQLAVIECVEKEKGLGSASRRRPAYVARGEFWGLSNEDEAAISRYILRREREMLRIFS